MAWYDMFPYTNFHEINLDYILTVVRNCKREWDTVKNEWNSVEDFITNYFDNLDVQEEINTKINEMIEDGTLARILNEDIFESLQQDVITLYNTKRNKDDNDYITMGMLTQEVREAMTGGSVAVVGTDAVGTSNIQDGAITERKLADKVKSVFLNKLTAAINTTDRTVTFNGRVYVGGVAYTITNYTLPMPTSTQTTWLVLDYTTRTATVQFTNSVIENAVIIGRTSTNTMNLDYSAVITKDGKPAFDDFKNIVTENLPDRGVTPQKLSIAASFPFLMRVRVDKDTTAGTISFNGIIAIGGHRYALDSTVNAPSSNTYVWAIPDETNDTATISISNAIPANGVFIGNISAGAFNLVHEAAVYVDGKRYHAGNEEWQNYPTQLPYGVTGPERIAVINLNTNTIELKYACYIRTIAGNSLTIPAQTITFGDAGAYYIYADPVTGELGVHTGQVNSNNYYVIGYIYPAANVVNMIIPHTVITKSVYFNNMPDMCIYGDSMVAVQSGLGVCAQILGRTGYYIRNRGIGGSGYIRRVGQNTTHRRGNNTPVAGTDQIIPEANNNVYDLIQADIASGNLPEVVLIWAGTNDIVAAALPVAEVVTAMENCIDAIQGNGSIPIILSPIRRTGNRPTLDAFVEAQRVACKAKGVKFVDLYNETGLNPNVAAINAKYYTDGLHVNEQGYAKISPAVKSAIEATVGINDFLYKW